MVWVRSEYADELAVLSAWLAALLPWNIAYAPEVEGLGGSVLYVRFSYLQVRYIFDVPIADRVTVWFPHTAWFLEDVTNDLPYQVWIVGAVLVGAAVALSVAMYVREEQVAEALPVEPVRLMGGLLTGGGLVLAVATVEFYRSRIFGEIPVPLGLIVLLVLGVTLLRVDLVGEEADATAA